MDNTGYTPTALSLCTGYGGIERGIERVIGPVNPLAYVEIEAYAIANLVSKMETGQMVPAPVWTNLKTLPVGPFRDRVDILTGGYPCQPFSAAGKRKGKDDPRHLWPWIKEIIRQVKPGICFFENVEGHISLGLREVLTDLVKLGYRVESDSGEPTWGIFSAAEVGAPHQRKRVFIMAHAQGRDAWQPKTWDWREGLRGGGKELADTSQQGPQRRCQSGEQATGMEAAQAIRHDLAGCDIERWPARPGEPQHSWEEPRVLADTDQSKQLKERCSTDGGEQATTGKIGKGDRPREESKIKPELGGTIDGPAGGLDPNRNRIDRLRLLGNGVVPATAAKAFSTLMGRILNPSENARPVDVQMELF